MNVARVTVRLVPLLYTVALLSLVVACSSSSTSKGSTSSDGGGGSEAGSGGGNDGGGGVACKVADGTYTVHSTAMDLSDGGFGCSAPLDMMVTYPVTPSDAGTEGNCATKSDPTTCTTTISCASTQGSIMSTSTTVTKVNADGKGFTTTQTVTVTSNGMLSTECVTTSVATPS